MAYIVMTCIVMTCIVMVYIVMAYIVMAYIYTCLDTRQELRRKTEPLHVVEAALVADAPLVAFGFDERNEYTSVDTAADDRHTYRTFCRMFYRED